MSRELVLAIGGVFGVVILATSATATDGPPSRASEPIVVPGADLAPFVGARIAELRLWRWAEGQWRMPPAPVDEGTDGGYFTRAEDGILDGNDELVLMADDLGEEAPAGSWPPGMSDEHPPLGIAVTDPLSGVVRFAYASRSSIAPPAPETRLVEYDAGAREVRSPTYTLGLAGIPTDGFVGIRTLSLFGGATDLLDRLKLRASVRLATYEHTFTEENVQFSRTAVKVAPPIAGPVRIVVDNEGWDMAYAGRITVQMRVRWPEATPRGGRHHDCPPVLGLQRRGVASDLS